MTRQFADSQSTSIETRKDNLVVPSLFRSSEESDWEGVVLRAFHEPAELDGLIGPVAPDTSLMLP